MPLIEVTKLHCEKCGHDWVPRQEDVRICPKCKSARFDRPRPTTPTDGKG